MIKAIDKQYCKNNLVQLMNTSNFCNLIVSDDEIILLKTGDTVLINKYVNHPNRNLFPFHENIKNDGYFNELFEYNKIYLNFIGKVGGYGFQKMYFFKGTNRALFLDEALQVDERVDEENVRELNREEIEKIFNSKNYDSMYILDRNGTIIYASNKKDGYVIKKNIIPSDKEIIKMELEDRIFKYNIARSINHGIDTQENYEQSHKSKMIDEIKDINIYGPIGIKKYSDMLLTSKNGKFKLQWFKLDFIEKDKFKLTTSEIPIIEPTVDDVIKYSNNHEIEYTEEPSIAESEPDFEEILNKSLKKILKFNKS